MHDRSDEPAARPAAAGDLPDAALLEINRLWTIVRAFSNTAHDVNNALMVIAGSAELLEARELEPPVRKRVETLRAEAARAATAVERLLTYARAEGGVVQLIEVWPIVETAAAMRAASAGRRRIALTLAGHDGTAARARADATRLLQAVLDLLLAAEDAVAGRRGARIVVSVAVAAAMVHVRVAASSEEGTDAVVASAPGALLTAAAQVWSAGAIAGQLGGEISVSSTDDTRDFVLMLPSGQ